MLIQLYFFQCQLACRRHNGARPAMPSGRHQNSLLTYHSLASIYLQNVAWSKIRLQILFWILNYFISPIFFYLSCIMVCHTVTKIFDVIENHECWVQNRPYLKNMRKKICFRTLRIFRGNFFLTVLVNHLCKNTWKLSTKLTLIKKKILKINHSFVSARCASFM